MYFRELFIYVQKKTYIYLHNYNLPKYQVHLNILRQLVSKCIISHIQYIFLINRTEALASLVSFQIQSDTPEANLCIEA